MNKSMGEPGTGLYPMRVVEQLTGLSRRQIRYYEGQGLLLPDRSQGGHRLYSPADVERLQLIKALMAKGFRTMEAVRRCLNSDLQLEKSHRSSRTEWTAPKPSGRPRTVKSEESDAAHYFERRRRWPND
jgi:DNA-binding transcriptional MerR regulator